jgi:OmpA family protein
VTIILRAIIGTLVILVASGPATSQTASTSGWYLGGSVGLTSVNTVLNGVLFNNPQCSLAGITCTADTSDSARQIFVGKKINSNLSVELGLANLGRTLNHAALNGAAGISVDTDQTTTVLSASAIGRRQIEQSGISAIGKLGITYWMSEASFDRTPDSAIFVDRTVPQAGVSAVVGLGLEFATNSPFKVRAGWDYYIAVGQNSGAFDVNNNTLNTYNTGVSVLYVGATIDF